VKKSQARPFLHDQTGVGMDPRFRGGDGKGSDIKILRHSRESGNPCSNEAVKTFQISSQALSRE
jgi:hypothetical protein